MINKSKKFNITIEKINSILNEIIYEINSSKTQLLFSHSITIKIDEELNRINFRLNENLLSSKEIRLEQQPFFNDIIKQLIEILNKMHFFNYHIRMLIINEKTNDIILELFII